MRDGGEEDNALIVRRPLAANARLRARRGHPWFAAAWLAAFALPGLVAAETLCDLLAEARERVQSLEQDHAELTSTIRVEGERAETILSNMENADERESFAKAAEAHTAAQAERRTLDQTYDQLEYSKQQIREELHKYSGELAGMKLTRRDLAEVESWPDVKHFRTRAAELESEIRPLIGAVSFDDIPALIQKVTDTAHLDFLRRGDFETFDSSHFTEFEIRSYAGEPGSQLALAAQSLLARVRSYGDAETHSQRGPELEAEIHSLADKAHDLRTAAAAKLSELDDTLRSLAEAMRRAGVSGHQSQPSGFRHGALSNETYEKRRRELEGSMKPLEAKIEQHRQQQQSILRRLSEIREIEENYRRAARALERATKEVPEFEHQRIQEARRKVTELISQRYNVEMLLENARGEVEQLQDSVVQKVAVIQAAIEDARVIPGRARANAEGYRHEQCRLLISDAHSSLGTAESGYQEIVPCLGPAHGELQAGIRQVRTQLDAVVCEPGGGPPDVPTGEVPAPGVVHPESRRSSVSGCPSVELEEGLVQVPSVLNLSREAATDRIVAHELEVFAFEYELSQRPEDDEVVTTQSPRACAAVAPGTTIRIGYNSPHDYEPEIDPGGAGTDSEAAAGAGGVTPSEEDTSQTTTGDDSGLFGQPQGFTAASGVKTVSSNVEPASGATPGAVSAGATGAGGPPAPSTSRGTGDAWASNAQNAMDSCDLGRALRNADILAAENPRHPWLEQNYTMLLADIAKQNAAETAIRQARAVLSRPSVTKADIQQATALARQAQNNSTRCISQQVSSLTGPIQAAESAVRQADSARSRAAAAGLLGSLTGVLNTAIAASGAGVPTGGGSGVSGGGGVDIRDVMAEAGLIPPTGGGGTSTTGGNSSGSATGATGSRPGGADAGGGVPGGGLPCSFCVISQHGNPGERVHYVYSLRRTMPNPSCPGSQSVGMGYYIFSDSPTDDEGRPLSYFPDEDVRAAMHGLGTLGTSSKVCGPCGTHNQARAVVGQRCPRPVQRSPFR